MTEFSSVGKSIPKIDARAKVTGRAIYADDLRFPRMLYGKVVRCMEYAHARVISLDLSEAAKVPGVVKVLAPKDVTQKKYCSGVLDLMASEMVSKEFLGDIEDQPIFTDHVKYQGDGICGIIARTEAAAEKAARLVKVEYEPLQVYQTAKGSSREGAIQFTPEKPGNMAFQLPEQMFPNRTYGWKNAEAAMKEADLVVEDTFYVPKVKQCQMEPHSYIAFYDDEGRLNCWTSTQMPKCVHIKISRLFELPMTRVKINQTVVGGAFGVKLGMIFEPQACAMAMAVPGSHVKITALREEDWIASESRHPGEYRMKIGFKKDGTPLAVDAHFTSNGGGYYTHASGVAFTAGAWLVGMYRWGACNYKGDRYYTNHAPCGAFRGYGNPQTNFVMEQLIDRGLVQLNIDPVEWRKKWHKGVGDDGWCLGVPYPSCALDTCLEKGAEAIGWKEKREKYAHQTGARRRGVGVAVMNHTSGAMPMLHEHTTCTVKLNEDATAEIITSCSDLGTGAHTALKQIAAEALGFPLEDVHMKIGDSDASGFDIGAHASRTLYVGGMAVKKAAEDAVGQIMERAAAKLEIEVEHLEMRDKKIFVKGNPERFVTVQQICYEGVYAFLDAQTGGRIGIPGQIQAYSSHYADSNSPPFAASFAEVEVDTETGQIEVLHVVNSHDIGRAIHPPSVEGQLEGGVQQALGMAITEETYYDANGLCLNSNFTDYRMFGPSDMPKCTSILVEEPDPLGPYGAKSCGESGLVAPTGAVANAIYNAIGIQFVGGPITPEKILKAIEEFGVGSNMVVPYGYGCKRADAPNIR
jgi:xanthine dehydrogenase molybdenum-binding subunit